MRKGLILLAAAASLGTAALSAAPASAQYHGGSGYHHGWDRHDRHADWRREHYRHERERDWRWHHRRYDHRYGNYYGHRR